MGHTMSYFSLEIVSRFAEGMDEDGGDERWRDGRWERKRERGERGVGHSKLISLNF